MANPSVFSNYFVGMDFAFGPSVTAASLDVLSLFSSDDVTINIRNSGLSLIGIYTVLGAPNTGAGAFFGVVATGGDDIGQLSIRTANGNSPGVDQVQWGSSAVPEPGSLALIAGIAISGVGLLRRRRK